MRVLLATLAAVLALPATAAASGKQVAIFFYPWYGTPRHDAQWIHWQQRAAEPPASIASAFYPARGVYSSRDATVLRSQMREIAEAGVGQVIVSWWGRGSGEDAQLPAVIEAARARGLGVAAHLEPYEGRTVVATEADIGYLAALGVRDFYVFGSGAHSDAEWAAMNGRLADVRTFANTGLVGRAWNGGFDGIYTYDLLIYDANDFGRICEQARKKGLLCAPSVGPGFDARRAAGIERVLPRRNGLTYDTMWRSAVAARADVVTITSYNEWHEGTQIEPARTTRGYVSYNGAWGLKGRAASVAYLRRTTLWSWRYRSGR